MFRRVILIAALWAQAAAAQTGIADFGATPNQAAVGAALDGASGPQAPQRAALLTDLRGLPTAGARADALGQLSPQSYTLLPRLVNQSLDAGTALLGRYLADRRTAELEGVDPLDASRRSKLSLALLGDVRDARYEARIDRPAARTDSRSIAFALDYQPREGVILGLALGIDGLDARLDPRRPRITLFNAHIGPYASISNGRVYLDGSIAYNSGDMKLRRQIGFGGFADRLTASAHSDGWAASAETGYHLKTGGVRIEPFAALHHRYAGIDGFVERGGAAALQIAPYRVKSLQSGLGARVTTILAKGNWSIRPAAQAEWRRELRGHADSRIEARFATADLPAFAFQPTRLARDHARVSAGLTAAYAQRTSVRIGYSGEITTDRRVHGLTLGISRRL